MKPIMVALYGLGFFAAMAGGVWGGAWLSQDASVDAAVTAAQPVVSGAPARAQSADHASSLWAWGNEGGGKTAAGKPHKSLEVLLAQAMRASGTPAAGRDPRDELRQLAKEDSAVMQQLMASYEKEPNSQTRQLIVSLLSGIEKPEVLSFSKRLASSADMAQRKDGFTMLQNLGGDSPEVHPVILQALSGDKSPEVIKLALSALRPPADAGSNPPSSGAQTADAPAIVAQLKNLTGNADPAIRLQSLLQLAQWDKSDGSQEQWSQALADQSPQVRQVAVTAIAQSGTQSATVKAALLGLASNPHENKDVRGNALQVLERFTLSQDEAANYSQLRSQILGL